MRYLGDKDYAHGSTGQLGILLVNLGTPDAPEPAAVRRYLAEFLWDPRVIELPRLARWLLLEVVVLRVRPKRSAVAYARVWSDEGSPLLVIGRRQQRALQALLDQHCGASTFHVALGMRYGTPSVDSALRELAAAGARRLIVLPLYPQFSATTTGAVFDALAAGFTRTRWLPDLRFISHYHDDAGYIAALAASVREAWATHGRGERLLMSFHGLPERYLAAGDPYHCECHKTARLLAGELQLDRDEWQVSFQSRVGREPWLKPYTDQLLARWANEGVGQVDVVCPGFSADCLETLDEIALENREAFEHAGGGALNYIPALNDRSDHVAALADLLLSAAGDWISAPVRIPGETPASEAQRSLSRELALARGASR